MRRRARRSPCRYFIRKIWTSRWREVESAGGKIVKPIFSFPGGRRFHFLDPAGNELAVWGK